MFLKYLKSHPCLLSGLLLAGFVWQPAQAQICIDSDGDGWGWDGSASCLIAAAACIDSDGDGWGWDGSASCRIDAATPVNTPGNTDTDGATNPLILSGRYNRSRDLIALHFDHAPDLDDGHAAAAAFVVLDQLDLEVQVVGGTHGVYSADRYVPASEALMNSIWSSGWLDAHNSRASAVVQAANRWARTLQAGGDVWIAEGGPSDFSAAVIRRIQQRHPQYQTRSRIHLIQHSQWNEDHALAGDLGFVRANTNYVMIQDGNEPNSTADFRNFSQSFIYKALASEYSAVWKTAFAYLSPIEKLDFSDTVELFYILGVDTSQIANADDFANLFF